MKDMPRGQWNGSCRGEEVEVAGRSELGEIFRRRHDGRGLPPGSGYDVVFCRNVLIYLHAACARERLLRQITTCLFVGGMLFVGHAEPLLLHKGEFRTSYRRLTQFMRCAGACRRAARAENRDADAAVWRCSP